MTSRRPLPTSYAEFFTRTFAREGQGLSEPAYLFAAADMVEAIDECTCAKPVVNLTAFVEGIGEHYVLTDDQKEHLEHELQQCGIDVSDEGTCSEHSAEE